MKPILILLVGWLLDKRLGDPSWLPHPVVGFGKLIALFERALNRGHFRRFKGAVTAILLIAAVYAAFFFLMRWFYSINVFLALGFGSICVFYCLAGKTLIVEVREVFLALDRSLEEGRGLSGP